MDDKKPRDYKKLTVLVVCVTAAALLTAVLALSIKREAAVPVQASPAQDGLCYYTPNPASSQESHSSLALEDEGPYQVRVYSGKIGVFRGSETKPFLTADVEVYLLPEEDIALLRKGFTVQTLAEARAILEDYQ